MRLQTLGRLAITIDGRASAALGSQPVRAALLAWIGIERTTTRGAVAAVLWPDRDESRARHALSQTLYQLSRDLGGHYVVSDHETLRADARLMVDAVEFEQALAADDVEAAVELYNGAFLDGQRIVATDAFETWVDVQRARYARLNRRARREQIRRLLDQRNAHGALEAARTWAGMDPLEDEAQHRVIELLASVGEITEAVRRFDEYASLLEKEQLSPLEETVELIRSLRAQRGVPEREVPDPTEPGPGAPEPARASAASSPTPSIEEPIEARPGARPARPRRKQRRHAVVAAALLLAVAAPVAVYLGRDSDGLVKDRVLVVPFDNETGDPLLAPVGDMAADWISQGLAGTGRLQVVPIVEMTGGSAGSRSTAQRMTASGAVPAARALGAGTVVSGRYYLRGDTIEFYAQISDVGSGRLVQALDPVRSAMNDPASAIDHLRDRVMGSLAARFTTDIPLEPAAVLHQPTYAAYLEFHQGGDLFIRGDFAAAIPHLQQATALDTGFVRPLLLAASAYSNMGDLPRMDSILRVVARRADRLAPYERAHLEWGQASLRGDLDQAYRAASRLALLAPGGPAHYVFARLTLSLGWPSETLRISKDMPTDPEWMPVWWNSQEYILGAYHALGRHRREIAGVRAVLRTDPRLRMRVLELRALAALGRLEELMHRVDDAATVPADLSLDFGDVLARTASELDAHGYVGAADDLLDRAARWYDTSAAPTTREQRWSQVAVLTRTGRFVEADSVLRSLRSTGPDALRYMGYDGVLAARRGDRHRALAIDDSLARLDRGYLRGDHTYWRAAIHAWLGDTANALHLLHQARAEGHALGFQLHADENLQPLQDITEFRGLVVLEK